MDDLDLFKNNISDKKKNISIEEYNFICHRVYQRGSVVSINENNIRLKCQKQRHKNKVNKYISKLGFNKNEDIYLQNYLIYFEEYFLYFLKNSPLTLLQDSTKLEQADYLRLIGKHYSIKKLSKIQLKDYDNNKIEVKLIFTYHSIIQEFSDEKSDIINIIFELNEANNFFKELDDLLKKYNISLNIPQL